MVHPDVVTRQPDKVLANDADGLVVDNLTAADKYFFSEMSLLGPTRVVAWVEK